MATYLVALTVKDSERFLCAWRALNEDGISTQLDQNIAPHVSLAHGDLDEKTFNPTDFWRNLLPEITREELGKVETVYDAPTLTRGGALLARPIFPNGSEPLLKTQTAIMEGFGWTDEQRKGWRERGLHLTLGTNVPQDKIGGMIKNIWSAWGEAAKIVSSFSAIALYSFDPKAKKFTKLYEYGFGS